jgi:hypothetical protein
VQGEIAYAERASADAQQAAVNGIGSSTWKGMATGALTGGYSGFTAGSIFGGEVSFEATGLIGAIGGAAIGGTLGGISGMVKATGNAVLTYAENSPLAPPSLSTYDSNLQSNIQNNCGVSVTVR